MGDDIYNNCIVSTSPKNSSIGQFHWSQFLKKNICTRGYEYTTCTPPKFNIAPKKWWLEDEFPIGIAHFLGAMLNFSCVSSSGQDTDRRVTKRPVKISRQAFLFGEALRNSPWCQQEGLYLILYIYIYIYMIYSYIIYIYISIFIYLYPVTNQKGRICFDNSHNSSFLLCITLLHSHFLPPISKQPVATGHSTPSSKNKGSKTWHPRQRRLSSSDISYGLLGWSSYRDDIVESKASVWSHKKTRYKVICLLEFLSTFGIWTHCAMVYV